LPGATRGFDILVLASDVRTPKHPDANTFSGKGIVWVPPAPEGCATHFTVQFTSAELTTEILPGWPGREAMGTRLIWKAELPNGQTVWLVALVRPADDWLRNNVTGFKRSAFRAGRRKFEKAGYSELEEARAFIYGQDNQQGTRWYIDISGYDLQD
jgi:hypothetical protein